MGGLISFFTDTQNLLSLGVGVLVFATVLTLLSSFGGGAKLEGRMKAVAVRRDELKRRYRGLITDLVRLIPMGLSAAVYTQTTDVEIETNGLMTYDREVVKMPEAELNEWHQQLYRTPIE